MQCCTVFFVIVEAEETDVYEGATASIQLTIKPGTLTKKFFSWPKSIVKKLGDKKFDLDYEIGTDEARLIMDLGVM